MDDAGKHAEFNEVFHLENIYESIINGQELHFNAYDEDVLEDEWLGMTEPVLWQDLVENTLENI